MFTRTIIKRDFPIANYNLNSFSPIVKNCLRYKLYNVKIDVRCVPSTVHVNLSYHSHGINAMSHCNSINKQFRSFYTRGFMDRLRFLVRLFNNRQTAPSTDAFVTAFNRVCLRAGANVNFEPSMLHKHLQKQSKCINNKNVIIFCQNLKI